MRAKPSLFASLLSPWLALCVSLPACVTTRSDSPTTTTPPATKTPGPVADAPRDDSPVLPMDPAVRTGKLDNGLTWYVRRHNKPDKRVFLWLAVDAGSVLEDEDQLGLAHFVEHMAFNGTERFAKNTMVDFFERSGMKFGADVNAGTSFDQTIYQLQVPTDDPKLVATGLDVLEDWAGAVSFDAKQVDSERGVVVEEWRLGRGASQRVLDKQLSVLFNGSRYADRKPIGDKEILEKAPVTTLRRFYEDWYRPDLMAVIVVGDVDPEAMQKDIERRFGDLKGPAKPRPRADIPVPLLAETRATVETDPELPRTTVSVALKGPRQEHRTEGDHRRALVEQMFSGMLQARLDEIRRRPDAPFTFAFAFNNSMARAVDVFQVHAFTKGGQAEAAASTLATELERVHRHGFLASELERQKASMLRTAERAVKEKDTVDGHAYVFQLVSHFLEDEAVPGPDKNLELAQRFVPEITLEDVNALAKDHTARKDRLFAASGPARETTPTGKELLAAASAASKQDIGPWTDEAVGDSLMATLPTPGKIVSREAVPEIGVTVWKLSNGAKVVIKPTDFKRDEILFEAFSPGGHSLAPAKRFDSASLSDSIVSASGVGDHDPTALRKLMAGKVVGVSPYVAELEEGMHGSASPQDLETMLQLVHLYFTSPRRDEAAFDSWRAAMRESVKNRDLNPQQVFLEQFQAFASSNHPRRMPLTNERLDAIDLDAALEFYRQRFANAGDFTFVFVGNVDPEQLEPLAQNYLASLPSPKKPRREHWRDPGVKPPKGFAQFSLEKGQDPKSFVLLAFHGDARWSEGAEDDLDMLEEYLGIRLREVLREEMSGVYGVMNNAGFERRPKPHFGYTVGFGCAPENVMGLRRAVFAALEELAEKGVPDDYVSKIKEQRRRGLETSRKENRFWLRQLAQHYRYGSDPREIQELDKKIDRVTSPAIQKASRRYLSTKSYIEGVLNPAPAAK